MPRAELTSERRLLTVVAVVFAAMALLAGADVVADVRAGTTPAHVIIESVVVVLGLTGALFIARRLLGMMRAARAAQTEASALAAQLAASAAEAERWRAEARHLIAGLGAALDRQFERWQLSPAEKEIALLLLKGLSHKEIAEVRSITEATARQQARAVYRKAGLTGRADLAAFFLEDLLLPGGERPAADP